MKMYEHVSKCIKIIIIIIIIIIVHRGLWRSLEALQLEAFGRPLEGLWRPLEWSF